MPLLPKALYKLGFFEGIVKSSKTIRQISRMIFKVALKQFCMNKTNLENDRFRFDSVPGIEMKPIFSRFSRAHFPIEMNKHKIGKITTQKFGLDISTLMYAS